MDRKRFHGLWAEWEAAKERQVEREALKLKRWEHTFEKLESKYYELRTSGAWISGPSSLLGIIAQSRRETYHCRILSWLMDPTGRHGLGHRFLEQFLARVVPARSYESRELARARPTCEVVAPSCRADVVVAGFTSTLVIEAKVDDHEGPEQCNRVFRDFRGLPDPHFAFLTPTGREPQTATGEAAAAFQTISFIECLHVLRTTIDDKGFPADEIAAGSMKNYLTTLEEEFAK